MGEIKVKIYSKINPFLSIEGEENGYHKLDTVFVSVSLYDEIKVVPADETRVFIDYEERNETNAYKAVMLMKELGGYDVEVYIKRGILSGGGVGASSADAAGVMRAMCYLYDIDIDEETLIAEARKIGSDVPYMLKGGWARLRGTGEELEFFDAPTGEEVLLAVKGEVNTGECFARYDQNPVEHIPADEFTSIVKEKGLNGISEHCFNALTEPAVSINEGVAVALKVMRESGLTCSMSGSGATVWGVGRDIDLAIAQRELIKLGFTVFRAKTVDRGCEWL